MIVVTGGTGRVGQQVVAQLRERNLKVRVVSRRPGQPQAGVETAAADLADPASLEPALRGADALFLLWPFTSAELTATLAPQVAKLAARHVTRIVYLSAQPAAERPGSFWALTERAIEDSGAAWTFLRPAGFASNTLMWADQIRAGDVVRWPFGAAARTLIDERDIAAVAVRALTGDGHAGARYLLSGRADAGRTAGRDWPCPRPRPDLGGTAPGAGSAGADGGLGRPRVRRVRPRHLGAVRDPPGGRHLNRPRPYRRSGAHLRRLGRGQRRRFPVNELSSGRSCWRRTSRPRPPARRRPPRRRGPGGGR